MVIKLICWFKNNEEWFYPQKAEMLDLSRWDHYEVINYYNDDNFLVYCWNGELKDKHIDSRVFKAKYVKG